MKKSKMIILIGPSGAGKSTLRKYACMKNADISCLVAVTDRGPRQGEIHGVDKFFLKNRIFEQLKNDNKLCLLNCVYDNQYAFFKENFLTGDIYICELYYKNLKEFLLYHSESKSIYIRPENIEECKKRLYLRGSSIEENAIREKQIETEIITLDNLFERGLFNYKFINNYDMESKESFVKLIDRVKGGFK